jgi:hypothetical protein
MNSALSLVESGLEKGGTTTDCKWCCTVMQSSRPGKELPEAYLCRTVETLLPHTTAFVHNGSIVAFSLLEGDGHRKGQICLPLEDYLEDIREVLHI